MNIFGYLDFKGGPPTHCFLESSPTNTNTTQEAWAVTWLSGQALTLEAFLRHSTGAAAAATTLTHILLRLGTLKPRRQARPSQYVVLYFCFFCFLFFNIPFFCLVLFLCFWFLFLRIPFFWLFLFLCLLSVSHCSSLLFYSYGLFSNCYNM